MAYSRVQQQSIEEDSEDEPVTFAEAIQNSAIRHVLIDQLQISEALSPSMMEQFGIHVIGILLSIAAGAANAIAFAKFQYYVSHVSGSATAIGLRMEDLQKGNVAPPVELVVYFIVGAFVCGLIVHSNGMRLGQARYEVVLFLVAAMELVCWWHELRYPEWLAAAMGLQNAMITTWSTAVLRTTHMTGTATDLGSSFGRIIMRFLRLRCQLEEEDWNQHIADRKKLFLMTCLLLSFICGGYVGSAGYKAFKLHSLLIPAGLTIILGVMHIAYCILKREEVAEEKMTETVFRRQISGNAYDAVDDPESAAQQQQFVQSKSPAMQFIRQISGQKPDPSGGLARIPARLPGV